MTSENNNNNGNGNNNQPPPVLTSAPSFNFSGGVTFGSNIQLASSVTNKNNNSKNDNCNNIDKTNNSVKNINSNNSKTIKDCNNTTSRSTEITNNINDNSGPSKGLDDIGNQIERKSQSVESNNTEDVKELDFNDMTTSQEKLEPDIDDLSPFKGPIIERGSLSQIKRLHEDKFEENGYPDNTAGTGFWNQMAKNVRPRKVREEEEKISSFKPKLIQILHHPSNPIARRQAKKQVLSDVIPRKKTIKDTPSVNFKSRGRTKSKSVSPTILRKIRKSKKNQKH